MAITIGATEALAMTTLAGQALAMTTLSGQALAITIGATEALAMTTLAGQALAMTTLSGQALAITIGATEALAMTTLAGQALAMTTLPGQALAITIGATEALAMTTLSGQALAMTTLSGQALAITIGATEALAMTTLAGQALAITVSAPLPVTSALITVDTAYTTGDFTSADDALATPAQNVLALSDWSWIAYNTASSAGALAMVKMQGSPDGTLWLDNSSYVTVTQNGLAMMTPTYFLKYSRVYYSGTGSSSASLNIYFKDKVNQSQAHYKTPSCHWGLF